MATMMPRDDDNSPIPALRLRPGGAHALAATAVTTRNAVAFAADTRVIGLFATVPVYVRTGGADVTATAADHYFPAGVYYDVSLGGPKGDRHSHVAVLRADGDGTLYVSEKE